MKRKGALIRVREWKRNFENLTERSEILLSLDSRYFASKIHESRLKYSRSRSRDVDTLGIGSETLCVDRDRI